MRICLLPFANLPLALCFSLAPTFNDMFCLIHRQIFIIFFNFTSRLINLKKPQVMVVPKSFPLHFPNLTRVNNLESAATAAEDLKIYVNQYLPLIILGDFLNPETMLSIADRLCTQPGALPTQRTLWLKDEDILAAVMPQLDEAIKSGFPNKIYSYDNIRALSIVPASFKAAYLIFKDPSLSPDPGDIRKSLSLFQMQRAFSAAISLIPDTRDVL